LILKKFLEIKFKQLKSIYLPGLLFNIYSIKHYLHSQLINLVYPLSIFEGENLIGKWNLEFKNKVLEKTFQLQNSKKDVKENMILFLINVAFLTFFLVTNYYITRQYDLAVTNFYMAF
jgi:hypothetical protein